MNYYLYRTTNKENGKFYIGVRQTKKSIDKDRYMGSGKYLLRAIQKYGKDAFEKVILGQFENEEELYKAEAAFVTSDLVSDPMCYNACTGGRGGFGGVPPWNKGKPCPLEVREKISKALAGKPISDEARRSRETIEYKEKMSQINSRPRPGSQGVPKSHKTREKISKANKGRSPSELCKKNQREAVLGRTQTAEEKKRRSESLKKYHLRKRREKDISCNHDLVVV